MQLGDATLGNTTIGFSTTQADISLAASSTSAVNATPTAGYNISLASTSTSAAIIYKAINLSYDSVASATTTLNISKGRQVSIQPVDQAIGETTLGDTTLGLTNQSARVVSNLISTVSKGRTVAFDSSVGSTLRINRRVDLVLESIAQSTTSINITKGVEVRYDARTETSLILVPDFDEIIGRTVAEGSRSIVVRADSARSLITRADANLN